MLNKVEKKYLGDVFHYVGIGFVGGSISHGFFSGERSIIMALIGLILFVLGEFIQKDESKNINYLKLLFIGIFYSIAIGMVNGGFQHFLDSPERSLWIIPLGFFISILVFPIKEEIKFKDYKKSLFPLLGFGFIITAIIAVMYFYLPKSIYSGLSDHHSENPSEIIRQIETKIDKQNIDNENLEVSETGLESESEHHGH